MSRSPFALAVAVGLSVASSWGQSVVSAHSGVIHLTEGQVTVDGNAVRQKFAEFGDVKSGQTLATQDGRAEVLLTPGVFLRVAENSSFKMVSNKLADTRIEALSGTLMIQVDELLQDNAIAVMFHGSEISLTKKGVYRIDAEQNELQVYDGEAHVTSNSQNVTVKKGHELQFGEKLEAKNFDTKDTDAFYRWNERRDEYISEANISAAKSYRDSGTGFNGAGGGAGSGAWAFNPWFGMFTYMPFSGMYYSPFGFGYYSPAMVGYLYMPGSPYFFNNGLVYAGVGAPVTRNTPVFNGTRPHPTVGSPSSTFTGMRGNGPSMAAASASAPAMNGGSGLSSSSNGGSMIRGGGMSGGGMSGGGMSGGGMSAGGGVRGGAGASGGGVRR